MHIGGMGEQDKLAPAVGKVFAKIKETSGGKGEHADGRHRPEADVAGPEEDRRILGRAAGEMANGVYKVTIGRTTKWAASRSAARWA